MVNYVEEARRLAEENQRRMAILLDEVQEIQADTARGGREFSARATAEMDRFWEDHAEEIAKAEAEAAERERLEAEARVERERQETEAREQREAIARSIAARKAHDIVTPIDEDDDPESEYYRRKSWLI
ncbi:hypothetical protein ACIBG0_11470 [Nocardia sp. NPDC050630]|uniref:hypothetical protein n=1 Tax=unclassified Nocardia TaxID=2637762 RepID=UPI0037BBE6BC